MTFDWSSAFSSRMSQFSGRSGLIKVMSRTMGIVDKDKYGECPATLVPSDSKVFVGAIANVGAIGSFGSPFAGSRNFLFGAEFKT
jgi:hypothetical protein